MPVIKTCGPPGKRTEFSYSGSVPDGIVVEFESGEFAIDAQTISDVIEHFRGRKVPGGFSMTEPTHGGVGAFLQEQGGGLTPRHGSFLCAALEHEGYVSCSREGNAIMVEFPASDEQSREREIDALMEIGFLYIGDWVKGINGLEYRLDRLRNQQPALYAFVIDEEVMYIGKTKRTLDERMYNYLRGGASQRTNIRVRGEIEDALNNGHQVQILGFVDQNPQTVGPFRLNLAAGLEDDIIERLNPPWNGGASPVPSQASSDHLATTSSTEAVSERSVSQHAESTVPHDEFSSFRVQIGKTYLRQGFLNVPVSHSALLGRDGDQISIRAPGLVGELTAKINRSVNQNNTPRIMGGASLRDWFRANVSLNGYILVTVKNLRSISIEAI